MKHVFKSGEGNLAFKHGFCKRSGKHPLYGRWKTMLQRCYKENDPGYKHYGGRGIKVCERWLDIKNFIEDMYNTFKEGLELDRINNDGNYEPSNCKWSTRSENMKNTRRKSSSQSSMDYVRFNQRTEKWEFHMNFDNKEEAEAFALRQISVEYPILYV